ncbi:MAG: nucleobase:cation symporter-2 family protein [Eubacteriales bacterium]|nr:nucleobase:cation symporter-2 family protein [Eubacteriales bacterium]
MSKQTGTKKYGSLFEYEGVPKMGEAIPIALQHVLAMMVGCITPAFIVSNSAQLSPQDKVLLIQMSLVIAGIATFIQLFPIWRIGAKLPMIIGASFAYVPTMAAVAATSYKEFNDPKLAVATILGAQIVGGLVSFIFGMFVKFLLPLFPPLVTGTVVFVIGLSLYPVGMRYMGGNGNVQWGHQIPNGDMPAWGDWRYWVIALITLAVVIFFANFTKGITKLASILFGIVIGYIISIPFGIVDFGKITAASWAPTVATPLHFGLKFDPAVIVGFVILYIVNSVQAIGDFTATTVGGMDRVPTPRELQGGIMAYGATNILAGLAGSPPLATYSQNVGIVGTTKVVNRVVMAIAAGIILISGIFPKFSALLTTIPFSVIGGATITVFASITMTGIRLISKQKMTPRNMTVVGLSVAMGMGFVSVCEQAKHFQVDFIPNGVYTALGTSPVVIAALTAIILNLVLRAKPEDTQERPE